MFNNKRVENTIQSALRRKLENYNPEPSHMPFHTRLLGKDRMAVYSFIQSLNTNFGTAIFEQVAREIAVGAFAEVDSQYELKGEFSSGAQAEITTIINELTDCRRKPNHEREIKQIRANCRSGQRVEKRLRRVDVFLYDGKTHFLIDLKTAKPNVGGFEKHKQELLEWAAALLYQHPDANVRTIIAFPYNPYAPKPYKRWTLRGMLETENQSQLIVGEEFWNFLAGGEDIYSDLLDCFENVGRRMRGEIDDYFNSLGERRYT